MTETQAWFVKNGLQDQVVKPEQIWDGRFLDYALGVLGRASK
jgi:hypothetical protein